MLMLTVKLLIAHILGDFVLQPNRWVGHKLEHKHASGYLYLHGLVHLLALVVMLEFDWSYWPYIIGIVGSHLLIDIVKLNLAHKMSPRILFGIDQLLHLLVIAFVVYLNTPYTIYFHALYNEAWLLLALAILMASFVSSIVMKIILSTWDIEEVSADDSLKDAGKYIGMIERLFVLAFIILNQWSAIGLLITAKSVFRFSDLTRAKDRKLTEYILIGTLLSFGFAIGIGLLYQYLVEYL